MKIAYFGPAATNTHAAAIAAFGDGHEYVAYPTISAVFDAVSSAKAHHGIVPIENSTEGVVRETIDCLVSKPPLIERELELDIAHTLMGPSGVTIETAQQVVSHPQPLAQCRQWLNAHAPHLKRVTAASTAAAASEVASMTDALALATPLAAKTYGLDVLASGIADRDQNATRFICLASTDAAPTGADRTSLVFTTPHERGALVQVLTTLDEAGVNMTRIESRPLAGRRWEYAFVVDVEGHRQTEPVKAALERLETDGNLVKVIGSYPRAT